MLNYKGKSMDEVMSATHPLNYVYVVICERLSCINKISSSNQLQKHNNKGENI